jgi:hypothetical protein
MSEIHSDVSIGTGDSTDQIIGMLLLCLCKQLDPCCLQLIALKACEKKGLSDPISVAALWCLFSQWYAQNKVTANAPPSASLTFQPYIPPVASPAAAPCLPDFLGTLLVLCGPEVMNAVAGVLQRLKVPCPA